MKDNAFYLLVAADIDKSRISAPSAREVARLCFAKNAWGIGVRTQYRTSLKLGDRVVVYIAGVRECRQSFVAKATIASSVEVTPMAIGHRVWPFTVRLADYQWLEEPVPIKPLLSRFSFISNPKAKKWGSRLQGGIVRITKSDFNLVTGSKRLT